MRRFALLAAAVAAIVAVHPAAAVERTVAIPGKFFEPSQFVILVGDTVTWRNDDTGSHDVAAEDRSFDSGRMLPGGSFSRTFAEQGVYPYLCSIHKYMRGEIAVYALVLAGPHTPVPLGAKAVLTGLAPAGSAQVALRREAGGTSVEVGTTSVATDGTFRFRIRADEPATYTATAGDLSSAPFRLDVAARVSLSAVRRGRGTVLTVATNPPQRRAPVRLQVYSRELFAWVDYARGRLDDSSTARFTAAPRRVLHLRAVITRGVGGYGRAVSRAVVVGPHRAANPSGG